MIIVNKLEKKEKIKEQKNKINLEHQRQKKMKKN
jgi:hypothetical protein